LDKDGPHSGPDNLMTILRLALVATCAALATSNAVAQITDVAATDTEIVLRLAPPAARPISIYAGTVYEDDPAAPAWRAVWSGTPGDEATVTLPRFDGATDRLYQRFLQVDENGRPGETGRYVTDLSGLTRSDVPFPRPTSPKGLQCIVDVDDAIALGVKHAAVNVSFSQLYDPSGTSPVRREVDGTIVAAREGVIAHLDATVKQMTDAGMRVNLILLNYLPRRDETSPLVHPATSPDAPNRIGAFNLTDAEGTRVFRGLVEILAERYSRPDAAHGLVSGYIVGNEVQSHHDWYNLGEMEPDAVIAEYAKAVRVADLAARRFHPDARVFVSLDHNWTRRHRPEPTRSMPGRDLLDGLHARLAGEGDVPWGVAFHPYPENLGNPRTWADETAKLSFDTPRITFKNLEVLTTYLRQPHLLAGGEQRRITLSEQGFHCLAAPEGETIQAAAYAYAFERVRRVEGIESFIYHRHVDHPGEGGLRLGLRENVPGTFDGPGKTRRIYDLYKVIDAPKGEAAAGFAKEAIGITSWDEIRPQPVTDETGG